MNAAAAAAVGDDDRQMVEEESAFQPSFQQTAWTVVVFGKSFDHYFQPHYLLEVA